MDPDQPNHPADDIIISVSSESGFLPETQERWARDARARGRHVKDPLAQTIQWQCQNAQDLENHLRGYLANPTVDAKHATLKFVFPTTTAFMVDPSKSRGGPAACGKLPPVQTALNKMVVSVIDALTPSITPREQSQKQKYIARTIVDTISTVDGYRYSFHNTWTSKEDEASRFSFYCNDSILNQGRAANSIKKGTGKTAKKPVYECEGLLSFKYSVKKNNLEVFYRHLPVHESYEARAPLPRKDSRRKRLSEISNPNILSTPGTRKRKRATVPPMFAPENHISMMPPPSNVNGVSMREDSLQPLEEFLSNAEGAGDSLAGDSPSSSATPEMIGKERELPANDQQQQGSSGNLTHVRSVGEVSINSTPSFAIPVDPNLERDRQQFRPPEIIDIHTPPIPPQTFNGPAPPVTNGYSNLRSANNPMSEIEFLRAKLADAEQRIQRLEFEHSRLPNRPWPFGGPHLFRHPLFPPSQYNFPDYSQYPPHLRQPPYNPGP